ncbi:hypothetical protein WCV18_13925, partial [Dickeya dianthicola]
MIYECACLCSHDLKRINDATARQKWRAFAYAMQVHENRYTMRAGCSEKKSISYQTKRNKKTFDDIFDADSRMYRDVLFFKNFVKNKKPVIIGEGKTDITYLQCVLESQAAKHRSIIINKELKISFFKPTKTISELFKVPGGTGDIGNLISNYSSYCDEFKRFSLSQPVIILIDNDSGAPAVRSLVNQITKKNFTSSDSFIHVIKNLYIMQTPLINGKDSAIEDFFDAATLNEKLDNKTLSYKGAFDISKHYGKNNFAEYVVKPKRKTIDF